MDVKDDEEDGGGRVEETWTEVQARCARKRGYMARGSGCPGLVLSNV